MRLPLAFAADSRDGDADKDERLTNVLVEVEGDVKLTELRPGLEVAAQSAGAGNGLVCFEGALTSVFSATLGVGYRDVWFGGLVAEDTLPSAVVPYDVAYANATWVMVGANGSSPVAMHSTDRVTWTATTFPSSFIPSAVGFIGGLFVALGSVYGGTKSSKYATSPDGITWTERTLPGGNSTFGVACPAIGSGRLCFFAQHCTTTGYSGALSTADGLNWTITLIAQAWAYEGQIIYEGGYFVIFTGELGARSSDGISWTASLLGTPITGWCSSICYAEGGYYGDGVYYAVGSYSDFAESYDGLNWAPLTTELTPYSGPVVVSLLYDSNLFWACQQSSLNLYVSDDMYAWTAVPTTISTNLMRLRKIPEGIFVIGTASHNKLCEVAVPYLGLEPVFTAALSPGIYDFVQSPL